MSPHVPGKKLRIVTTKTCYACRQTKPVSEFYRSNVKYYQKECKERCRVRKAKWHRTEIGKLSSTNTKLKRRFGITLDEYNELLQKQNYECLICGAKNSTNGHRLAVDHSHVTGKVRALLCKACNVAIGNLQDNPEFCEKAAAYLRAYL